MKEFFGVIWKTIFVNPSLNLLILLYGLFGNNLGLAVIGLAVVIRLILIPGTKKQLEMTKKMSDIKPRLDELQVKYKNNKELMAKEQMKLYKEFGYNPLGCVTTLVPQILILSAIYGVITAISKGFLDGLYGFVQDWVFGDAQPAIFNLNFLFWDLTKSFNTFKNLTIIDPQRLPYLVLGIIVGSIQYVTTLFIQNFQMYGKKKKKSNTDAKEPMSQDEMQMQMSKSMITIFPVMTAYITLSQPSILGIYWIAQSVMSVVQYIIIDRKRSFSTIKKMIPFLKKDED